MRKIDFYEFVGVIAPGGLLLFGLSYIFSDVGILLQGKDITFGELGLFVIIAYVAGHLVQCVGNFLEHYWWKATGGKPTDWVRFGKQPFAADNLMKKLPKRIREYCIKTFEKPFLSDAQRQKLPAKIKETLKIQCKDDLAKEEADQWFFIGRQAYASVKRVGLAGRIDIFNGNYGMCRGIAASLLVLFFAAVFQADSIDWRILGVIGICFGLALLRMHRFSVHYARELFVQLLTVLPDDLKNPPAKEGKEDDV